MKKLIFLAVLFAGASTAHSQTNYEPYYFGTFAGGAPSWGNTDGFGTNARFNNPSGVAIDENTGDVYVADSGNHTIRKITPDGVVTTFAGTPGVPGTADGRGAEARFRGPSGVAVDNGGNVYVADTFNDTIRKITPTGDVTTLAGMPGPARDVDLQCIELVLFITFCPPRDELYYSDGVGASARFNWPSGLAVDSTGNVYVADTISHAIRKITSDGLRTTMTTIAGGNTWGSADGTGTAATFDTPLDVAVDDAGNLYVADYGNKAIRKITPGGQVSTLAGSPGISGAADGTGSAARFRGPAGVVVALEQGTVYVADAFNHTIRVGVPAVQLVSAGSRKTHATAGSLDVNLPLGGNPGIECRSGGASGDHQVIMTFTTPIAQVTSASATPDPNTPGATGSVSSVSVNGSEVTVNLTGVSNGQTLAITLSGVTDGTATTDVTIPMGVLLGDSTGDGTVNSADAQQTRNRSGQSANSTNFRSDVNTDGSVNSGDAFIVRARSGTSIYP